MNIDFVRGITAHLTASFVIVAGLGSLIWLTANGTVESNVGVPAIVGIVGGAIGFLFGAEISKQASKQTARDIMQVPPGQQQPPTGP